LNFEDENSCSYEYEYIFLAQAVEIIGVLFAFYLIDVIGRSLIDPIAFQTDEIKICRTDYILL
jgi:hypothetical protein